MKTRLLTLAELRLSPEFNPQLDVYRRQDGTPVTINCDYGHMLDKDFPHPPSKDDFTVDELQAIRHAVRVWQTVCFLEKNDQTEKIEIGADGRVTNWNHPDIAKSRLLGRMIHDGLPPTRSMPPYEAAGRAWWNMEGGDPFRVAEETPLFAQDCPKCNGVGTIIQITPWRTAGIQPTSCQTCDGTGSVRIEKQGTWHIEKRLIYRVSVDVSASNYKKAHEIADRAALDAAQILNEKAAEAAEELHCRISLEKIEYGDFAQTA